MLRLFRIAANLFTALILLGLGAAGLFYWLAARSLPDYDGQYSVRGLDGRVEIVRDNVAVPHVFGDTEADVYFGLGFAHAQDRLWQMMMLRRTVQGRLSEMFGERTFRSDELMRRLALYPAARASQAHLTPETQRALRAYADGVNAWLEQVNRGALGRGAPEMFVFKSDIAPWAPADSLAILKLIAFRMTGHLEDEVLRMRTALLVPDRVQDLMPDAPGNGIAALPEFAALRDIVPGDAPGVPVRQALAEDPLYPLAAAPLSGASNAWAAAPSRSATGSTLLANDPHLDFTAPGLWYLARLDLPSGGVIGGTIPGIPAVMVGRSQGFGWGMTASFADTQDLFLERLNPANQDEVQTPDGFAPLTLRQSIIRMRDAAPITIDMSWSDNGPVLPADQFNIAAITPPGHVVTLAWTGLSERDTTLDGYMALMRAGDIDAGIQAGRAIVAPAINLVLADQDDIAMKLTGALPRRQADHQSQGRIPSYGWVAQNRWDGTLPYSANPEFRAPRGGILGNTNNKVIDRPFPNHVSFHWGDTQRIQRWQRLMQNREVHTRESFMETQLDIVSPSARALLPLIAAELWFTGDPAPEGTPERRRQRALEMLAEWNGEMNEHLPEPVIYSVWVRALQQRLIRDDLGPLARAFTHVEPIFLERVFRDVDGASAWCDVLQSAAIENCPDMARLALDDALLWIDERMGGSLESLRWGDLHQATHDHPVLGRVPVLRWFVNIRQSTSGGDNTLMRWVVRGMGAQPYENVHGAAYRGIYDFADPDSSVFVTATGQSGHFLSRHYDDLGELWRRGEYVPMSLDPGLARAAGVGVTRLTPAP